jgi:hypothetical protein
VRVNVCVCVCVRVNVYVCVYVCASVCVCVCVLGRAGVYRGWQKTKFVIAPHRNFIRAEGEISSSRESELWWQ